MGLGAASIASRPAPSAVRRPFPELDGLLDPPSIPHSGDGDTPAAGRLLAGHLRHRHQPFGGPLLLRHVKLGQLPVGRSSGQLWSPRQCPLPATSPILGAGWRWSPCAGTGPPSPPTPRPLRRWSLHNTTPSAHLHVVRKFSILARRRRVAFRIGQLTTHGPESRRSLSPRRRRAVIDLRFPQLLGPCLLVTRRGTLPADISPLPSGSANRTIVLMKNCLDRLIGAPNHPIGQSQLRTKMSGFCTQLDTTGHSHVRTLG